MHCDLHLLDGHIWFQATEKVTSLTLVFWKVLVITALSFGTFKWCIWKIFWKTNISYHLIRTRAYVHQVVRNVSFSGNFAYLLNAWSIFTVGKKKKNLSFNFDCSDLKWREHITIFLKSRLNIVTAYCIPVKKLKKKGRLYKNMH